MKKAKVLSFAFLPMVMAMLASCGHEHTFEEKWSHDEKEHWHAANCEHYGEKKDVAPHEFGDDTICDICGYDVANPAPTPHEHDFKGDYQKDETNHWQKCECGEAGPKEAHTMVEGVCSVCGYEQGVIPPSPEGDYVVTPEEWEAAPHSEKPFMFADNYKADCTFTIGSGDKVTVRTHNIEVDGTKAKISSNIENTKYFSFEESDYYIYSTTDEETFVKNYSKLNPILEYYGMLEPFGNSSAFTLDDTARCYKAESLMEGLYSNISIYFKNKAITKFEFDMYMESQRLTLAHVVINATYGGQVVDLPEVSPPVTEPVYGYKLNDADYVSMFYEEKNGQWEVYDLEMKAGDTLTIANTNGVSGIEVLTGLAIGGTTQGFEISEGVLTAGKDGIYSFYLCPEFENDQIYIADNTPVDTVTVTLSVIKDAGMGNGIYFVSSLVDWDVSRGIRGTWTEGDVWVFEIEIPANTDVEYKFVVSNYDEPTSAGADWEGGSNRLINEAADASYALTWQN